MNGFGDISEQICRSGVSDLHQQQQLMLQLSNVIAAHPGNFFFPFGDVTDPVLMPITNRSLQNDCPQPN